MHVGFEKCATSVCWALTGMVGQQFIARLAGHPWFNVRWLAASERSLGKSYAEAAPWRLASPMPDVCRDAARRSLRARARAEGPLFGARRESRRRARAPVRRGAHRAQQRAQPPDGSARPAADSGDRTRRSSVHPRRAAAGEGLVGRDCHESELRGGGPRDGAGPAPAVQPPPGRRDDASGGLGRGLSGRRVARHPGQHHSVHRWRRRREDPG